MSEVFVDGVRSIAVANGVARIELVQLKRGESQTKLEPDVVATLLIPVGSLKEFANQLNSTVKKLNQAAQARQADTETEAVDSALENL